MKEVGRISSEGHIFMMKNCKNFTSENELKNAFIHYCMMNGCKTQAYSPICASGTNAAILHYVKNDKIFGKNDMVLCDMGAFGNGYCSDISTTFPTSGTFTKKQQQIYEIVLGAQLEAIKKCQKISSFKKITDDCFKDLLTGLKDIGILSKGLSIEDAFNKVIFSKK